MSIKPLLGLILASVLGGTAAADTVQLAAGHPERYTVVKGDTLWSIAGRFLKSPWRWEEVWRNNRQIANPHLIYPGDVIELVWIDGQPQLRVVRGRPVVKLSPAVRSEPLDETIPTIPSEVLRHFLSRTRVVDDATLDNAGYILAPADERLLTGSGDRIHARKLAGDGKLFTIVRRGKEYRDPDNAEVTLGREAIYIGAAHLEAAGDPATLTIAGATREVRVGDHLLPSEDHGIERDFHPRAPLSEIRGRIVDVVDGLTQIGQFQVLVVDKGLDSDLRPGDVLAVYQSGRAARDPYVEKEAEKSVTLPDQRAGVALVFQVFQRVSYALVMEATRAIHVRDTVRNP